MPWPRGVPTTWNERLPDDAPCRLGHVRNFYRKANGGRGECRVCRRRRMKRKRVAAVLRELREAS